LIVTMLFVGATLGGCALFARDVNYYNNQVVARVGADITITKKQLIDAFNNFGYQYLSQGMSQGEAYNETLDQLINREIASRVSADMFGYGCKNTTHRNCCTGQFMIKQSSGALWTAATEREAEEARKVSFDYVTRSFRALEQEIRTQRGWAITDTETPAPEPAKGVTYTPFNKYLVSSTPINVYNPSIDDYVKSSGWVINLDKYKEVENPRFVHASNAEFIAQLKLPRGEDNALEKSITNQAWNRLIRTLRNNEKGMRFSKLESTDEAVLTRELVRVQIESEKSLLLERLEIAFEQGITTKVDFDELNGLRRTNFDEFEERVQNNNQLFVDNMVRDATQDFRNKVFTAVRRYERGFERADAFTAKLLDNLASVYFAPREVANKFFTVSHILLGYSDEQNSEISKINARYAQDKNKQNRDNAINTVRGQLRVTRNDAEGNPVGLPMTANQALAFIQSYVAPHIASKPVAQKQLHFRDMIYAFNSDPGMQNPDFEYVIGIDERTDKSENSAEADNMSRMVPEFTKASRELHAGAGDTRGSMSELVWTDYGAHIIMYTRNITDFIFTNSSSMVDAELQHFMHSTMTSYGNKTYFDLSVDSVTRPAYSNWEHQFTVTFKDKNKVVIYKDRFKDLTKSR